MAYRVKVLTKRITTVNELVFAVRNKLGMNQTIFGEKLGYSRRTIINWESGDSMSPELIAGIKIGLAAERLKLPVDEILLGLEDSEARL